MTVERRLEALESRFGLRSDERDDNPTARSQLAIEAGRGRMADFRTVLGSNLRTYRALVVVHADIHRRLVEAGRNPSPWWPLPVAAAIAACPVGQDPDPALVSHLLTLARFGGAVGEGRPKMSDAGREWCLAVHRAASTMVVALGDPTGRPLRSAIARGEYDDAGQVVKAAGLRVLSDGELARRYPGWQPAGNHILPEASEGSVRRRPPNGNGTGRLDGSLP